MQVRSKISHSIFAFLLVFIIHFSSQTCQGRTIVYFAPDDHPQKYLISYLKDAKTRIYAAVYMFTDEEIAEALIDAKKRKVDVQIITDQSSVESQHGKISLLCENEITTYVFKTNQKSKKFLPLMHNKFAIIDNNVWTGSFNWTFSANNKNQENVIYTTSKTALEKYLAHFEKLKKRCRILSGGTSTKEEPTSFCSSVKGFFGSLFKW